MQVSELSTTGISYAEMLQIKPLEFYLIQTAEYFYQFHKFR